MRLLAPTVLLLSAALLSACGGDVSTACTKDADCGAGKVCRQSACVDMTAPGVCSSGATRPCGNEAIGACRKGTQRCVNDAWETACAGEVTPAAETCNGLDDDCDGTTDEGVTSTWYVDTDGDGHGAATDPGLAACAAPAGSVASNDDCDDSLGTGAAIHPGATELCDAQGADEDCDGMANEGCSCTTPGTTQPCCAGRGTQSCDAADGGTTLSACSVLPTLEVCNGVDDDCDGQTDEGVAVSNLDGGTLAVDGGVALADGTCAVGLGACARSGATACTAAALVCSAAPGAPASEVCNGIDDDCDGQVDQGFGVASCGQGVCARTVNTCVAGVPQSCVPGSPSAEVCNSLDDDCNGQADDGLGTVSCGVGACARSVAACVGGTTQTCVPGAPATELCDGVDNDCDGQVDEGQKFTCYADPDGDLYPSDTTPVMLCPDLGRPAAGLCPVGYVAPNANGIDCAPNNAAQYRFASSRADADQDFACTGPSLFGCEGAAAPSGRRFDSACGPTDDCNDTNAAVYRLMSSRTDADGDTYCTGAAAMDCVGTNALPGRRFEGACSAPDDCNDGNGGIFRIASVRTDADNDGYCVGTTQSLCIGSSPPAPYRIVTSCQGDDCRDTNALATTQCVLTNAYTTSYHQQTCPQGATTFNLTTQTWCPLGFTLAGYRAEKASGAGSCVALSPTSISQTCAFLDGSNCRVVGDCWAN